MSQQLYTDPEMQEIFESFVIETRELLDALTSDLMLLESNAQDAELLNRIFRSFHTIKGTASFMGFDTITRITHCAEDLLNKLRRFELSSNTSIVDTLFEVHDWIVLLIEKTESGQSTDVDYSETIHKLLSHMQQSAQSQTDVQSDEPYAEPEKDAAISSRSAFETIINDPSITAGSDDFTPEELELIQSAFSEINSSFKNTEVSSAPENAQPSFKKTEPETNAPSAVLKIQPEQENGKQQAAMEPKATAHDSTIRVDVSRVETLMDLSGELVLGRNRLSQIADTLRIRFENDDLVRELLEASSQIDFVTSEIQSAVMRMRMIPIGKLYQKAPRIVRDIAREFKKEINLVLQGEETEIDRTIIEELNDPLIHMLRNSCDHGIELPDEREAVGKPRTGTITLDAEQEGNMIVIRIIDDGAGLNPDKLKAKAIDRGLITQEQAAAMSRKEAYQLIFAPGFSMAKTISNVSGRGVGMDVVRTNIQKLKGLIEIDSEVGKGTTFTIKLPLTLAIIQGMLVKVANETYALPLSSVIEVVAHEDESVYTINQQEVVRIRQQVIPLVRLGGVLETRLHEENPSAKYIVVVGVAEQRVGLVVDELLGQKEIVIKSLGTFLGQIQSIAGSTILGDGRVIMIIDTSELIRDVFSLKELQS